MAKPMWHWYKKWTWSGRSRFLNRLWYWYHSFHCVACLPTEFSAPMFTLHYKKFLACPFYIYSSSSQSVSQSQRVKHSSSATGACSCLSRLLCWYIPFTVFQSPACLPYPISSLTVHGRGRGLKKDVLENLALLKDLGMLHLGLFAVKMRQKASWKTCVELNCF